MRNEVKNAKKLHRRSASQTISDQLEAIEGRLEKSMDAKIGNLEKNLAAKFEEKFNKFLQLQDENRKVIV